MAGGVEEGGGVTGAAPTGTVVLRLSIWRDYSPPHDVALHGEQMGFKVVPSGHLQAEVYSWPLQQDYLAGISNAGVRDRLRELLDKLEGSRPPANRSIAVLRDFVAAAEKAVEDREAISVPWDSEGTSVAINPLLSLVLHLKWIIRCFQDRPGISVSIR